MNLAAIRRRTHFCRVAKMLLAGILISAATLFAQQPLQPPPPPPPPPDTFPAGLDSNQVGLQTPAANKELTEKSTYPYNKLDYDIARWENFLKQAREQKAALEGSPDSNNRAEAKRLSDLIPGAEAHLAALQEARRLEANQKDCGLTQRIADWQSLLQFIELERQQVGPAAAMMQNLAPVSQGIYANFGAAGQSMMSASAAIMQRQLENDTELAEQAESNINVIVNNCIQQQAEKNLEDFKKKLEEANGVADQAAKEAEALAEKGQFKDEAKIRELLTKVLIVARANQLMGNDNLGLEQQKTVTHAAKSFIQGAANKCNGQSFQLISVVELDRMNELLGADIDLSACYNRLYETTGTAGPLPYRLRHCGPNLSGTWKMQVTRGTVGGQTGQLQGEAEVPPFGDPVQVPAPAADMSHTVSQTGSAYIEAVGSMRDAATIEGRMRVSGPIRIVSEIFTKKPGVLISTDMKMRAQMKVDSFIATPTMLGTPSREPGMSSPEMELGIAIINGNEPCNPNADVWSYPSP